MMTSSLLAGSPPPEPPAQLTGAVINSTSVELMWVAPSNQGPNEIIGYTLSYKTSVGQIITVDGNLGVEQRTYEVVDLEAGMTYTFRVAALNMFGAGPSANLTLTLPGKEVDEQFYEEVWFFGVAAVGGALIVAIVIVTCCICICCCCKCAKKDGKYYITSRRTTSSMSSNGFSEYHNKSRSQTQMIQIHSSPTPSRRSTDYADIGPGRFPQTNSGYPNPQTMMMNGHVGHHAAGNAFPHDQHIPHDSHMGMHQGQFNPNEQGYPHENVPNMTHQFTRGEGQDYPDGGVAQSHHVRGQFDQRYPPDSHANLRDQFRHNQQEYPLQDMHRDQFNLNINEQEYPLQDMHRDQSNPNINEQEYPLQDMHNMRGMSYQLQDNSSSGQMSNRFVDTLTRVHTPPNPHNEYPDSIDYPAPSSRNSQSTEESWNPSENLNPRGHMTNNLVSRSSSFMSTVSTNSFERGPLPPNISPKANDHRGRGHTALSPLPENQFFEQGHHNGSSMQDLQHLHPPRNRSRSVGQRMNRMGNQDSRNRAHSFEGMLDMELNQQRMEHGESNLDIQQRALPPLPTAGMESGHITSLSPVPNPHSIEYTMNPEVQMSHSQSVPPVQGRKAMQYPGQNSQQPPRSYQQHENQARSHGYPSQPAHVTNHPPPPQRQHHLSSAVASTTQQKLTQPQHPLHQKQQQMSLPPPPPFIGEEQPTHLPTGRSVGGQNFRGHHSKNQKPQQHPLSLQQQHHPGVVQSMTQLQHLGKAGGGASGYKPEISDHHQHHHHHQRQQSLPDEQQGGSMLLPAHQQQNFNHGGGVLMNPSNVAVAPQHVRSVNQSTPNLAFSPAAANIQQQPRMMNGVSNSSEATPTGFRRIPMTGGHTLTQYNDEISQDTVEAWDQVDQIQQQLDLEMQNMLTPRVTDEMERGGDQFLFQNDTLNLDDSINSTSSFLSHTHSMVSPVATAGNMKPPNGFPMTSSITSSLQAPPPVRTKPPKVAPKMTSNKSTQQNLMNSFDSDSQLQSHKRRPSYPENDPKKPQLKKGKYPKAVWVQKSMNRAIESSSDSESDSDMSMDTVIAGPASAGDTESLKSSHV